MIRVGVIRGGTSHEYDESLKTGAYVLRNLPRDFCEPVDIFIDRDGVWYMGGVPLNSEKLKHRVDVIWNSLNGFYGADGKVQQMLDALNIPYTGTGPFSSAIFSNNRLSKQHLVNHGIKIPQASFVESWDDVEGDSFEIAKNLAREVSLKFSPPWSVKPISRGYANTPIVCRTRDELIALCAKMCELKIPIMIEEVIFGKKAGIVSVPGFRGIPNYTFIPHNTENLDSKFSVRENEQLQKAVAETHKILDLGHYAHIEAIISPKGQVYISKVETQPSMHEGSFFHHSLGEVGATFAEFAKHVLEKTLKRK